MTFSEDILSKTRPTSILSVQLPRRVPFRVINGAEVPYYPSPIDWSNEILYFLLPDRFSDGLDSKRPVFDRSLPLTASRPVWFRWDGWGDSGGGRWQGGTLQGVRSRLDYLANLGITALWIGPIFKQRRHSNEYHGYAIQDFLEIDPHFGTRQDLVELVIAAHERHIRLILDVIFNHSGHNWDYEDGVVDPKYKPWPDYYEKGFWLDGIGNQVNEIKDHETGVWPVELQAGSCYTRAGKGSLGGEDIDNDHAEMKRTDFDGSFRDFNFDGNNTLNDLARCYKYWIALADIDGMRLDTLKHVPEEAARNFCGTIKEFAANLGKADFFLVGEVGGPDSNAGRYLDVLELNLNATLDIGDSRIALHDAAKGLREATVYFDIVDAWDPVLGSHRRSAHRHVKVIDDHDHVSGRKVRFSTDASTDHQIVAAVAIQLFTLGIPCIYYGTEQAFAGPEESERQYLSDFGGRTDKYLRETMFGAEHSKKNGADGIGTQDSNYDVTIPGFGAFGTVGRHFFDEKFGTYRRIKELNRIRKAYPALRYGRQYLRPIRNFGQAFSLPRAGELISWSRILDEEELLCIVNGHGNEYRGADILVDPSLNADSPCFFKVIGNTAEIVSDGEYSGTHRIGEMLQVQDDPSTPWGAKYVEIRTIAPSEVIILTNRW